MSNVIDFEKVRKERLRNDIKNNIAEIEKMISAKWNALVDLRREFFEKNKKSESYQDLEEEGFEPRIKVDNHPMTLRQKEMGRYFLRNIERKSIFDYLTLIKKMGYVDISVERMAIEGAEEGFRYVSGFYGVYGRKPGFYNLTKLKFD